MTDSTLMRRIAEAYDFAAQAHAGQTRKGAAAEPYINHVTDVAARLARSPEASEAALLAAILHDVAEDTERTLAEIEDRFGPEVAALVAEVTDDKSLPKAERKRLQVVRAAEKSIDAKRVKLADKASNLASLSDSPPRLWNVARRREYLGWARDVAAGLRGVDPSLEEGFDREAARLDALLGS